MKTTEEHIYSALLAMCQENVRKAAETLLTHNKNVLPEHQYVQSEGDPARPTFLYQDPMGNYVRYTNAPQGHKDRSQYHGDPELHTTEPQFESNPEYFTPDGRKLSRCPDCAPEAVEWNVAYNPHDPQNMWVGRWPDPESGESRYTYLDADLRTVPQTRIHQQNVLVDVQLESLRVTVQQLFQSDKLKDQVTAIALALMDQGRFRAIELATLRAADVKFQGNLVRFGRRQVYVGGQLLAAIEALVGGKAPDEPLLSVPQQNMEGEPETQVARRIGPHYLAMVLDYFGISLLALQTYHASQCYSREVQRLVETYQAPWAQATQQALLLTALEWGHDFQQEMNTPALLHLIEGVLVDPVVVQALDRAAEEQGLKTQVQTQEVPPAMIPIPYISMDLITKTPEEQEFSQWLHSVPLHEYV